MSISRHRLLAFVPIVCALLVGARPDKALCAEKDDLARLVDAAFSNALKKYDLPGGVAVIVKDGEIIFAHGYGYADLERKIPVKPDTTMFYLASVTKTFTATAVMQQVELGRLDLDRDVNYYLQRFKAPPTYPEPVTLRTLLTHTAGFDDRNIGYLARSADEVLPLGEYLRLALPPRVKAPGQISSYSNHGYGLAGHLVELASGQSFAAYLENNIFRVVGMHRSTAVTPPPPRLSEHAATLYVYNRRTDKYEPSPPGYRNLPPAGTVWASGCDMGLFLLAHLQDGVAGTGRILKEETAAQMHARQFSHHPRLPGFCLGFYERFHSGGRVLEHAGGFLGAATLMALVPEKHFGVFLATNQSTSAPHYAALRAALDYLYPVRGGNHADSARRAGDWAQRARRFEGSYQNTRYSRKSLEKLAILDSQIQVAASESGHLAVRTRDGQETRWIEVEPLLFRRLEGRDYLAFDENPDGRIAYMYMSLPGSALPSAFERLPWYETLAVQLPYMLTTAAIFTSTFTIWPLAVLAAGLYRRLRGRDVQPAVAGKLPGISAGFTGILVVVFVLGLDQLLGSSQYRQQMVYGMPPAMIALLWIPVVLTGLAGVLAHFTVRAWRRRYWNSAARIYYSLVTLAAMTFIPFLWNWNLLPFTR